MASSKYIMSMGDLKRKGDSIVLVNEKGNTYIPIMGIKELYCLNEVNLNTKLLGLLSKAGITVHFFDYYQQYAGSFYPKEQLVSGKLTVLQSKAYLNQRLILAKAFVLGISKNVHHVLYHYYKHGCKEVKPCIDWVSKDLPRLIDKELNVNQLLFLEGEIWKRFYNSFQYFLPGSFEFTKRVKRPPDNPLNALISLGNSILYTKTITQIYRTHLNQSISYLHEPSQGRFSLCLDLCEVFKPIIVFKTIFENINNRKIQVDKHFDKKMNYCLLNGEGRKIFIGSLEERLKKVFHHPKLKRKVSYQTAIRLDAYKLVKYLVEDKPFKPFNMKELM